MKFFNISVTVVLMAFSISTMATEVKKHDFHKSSDRGLHMATDEENVLTFLSRKASFSGHHNLHRYSNSVLNNPKDISGSEFSQESSRKEVDRKSGDFHIEFDSNYHGNIERFGHLEHLSHSRNDEFDKFFHAGDRGYDGLESSLNDHFCGHYIPSPVPEPETYAMMIAGLLLLGASKRRKL